MYNFGLLEVSREYVSGNSKPCLLGGWYRKGHLQRMVFEPCNRCRHTLLHLSGRQLVVFYVVALLNKVMHELNWAMMQQRLLTS